MVLVLSACDGFVHHVEIARADAGRENALGPGLFGTGDCYDGDRRLESWVTGEDLS